MSPFKKLFSSKERIIFISIITILVIAICAGGFFGWQKINSLEKQVTDSRSRLLDTQSDLTDSNIKRKQIEDEKDKVASIGAELYLKNQVLQEAIGSLVDGFDDLDKLILADDKRNVEAVTWYTDHGEFDISSGELAEAAYRFRKWKEDQSVSDATYSRIKRAVTISLDEIIAALEKINSIDFNALKNTDARID